MKTLFLAVAAVFAVITAGSSVAAAAPSQGRVHNAGKPHTIKNRYIVILKDTAAQQKDVRSAASKLTRQYHGKVRHTYKHSFKGFVGEMSAANAKRLAKNPEVKFVEQDAIATGDSTQMGLNTWGLDRIDQRSLPLDTTYTYPDISAQGVNAYVIDSGIRMTHNEFGGRATSGWDFVENDDTAQDCHGHGTHVAGTIGSSSYGVAKDINLVGVRVLDCNNSGTYSNIIAGIDWVTANATLPAVANVSLGGINSLALDNAVQNSVAAGITYTVSAGNSNTDACTRSPARAANAITVGASNESDQRWTSSNYGSCVDIFAPGSLIRSAYGSSDVSTARMNGTSAAAPHVAGVAALLLAANPTLTPAEVTNTIIGNATVDILADISADSPNRLLFQ